MDAEIQRKFNCVQEQLDKTTTVLDAACSRIQRVKERLDVCEMKQETLENKTDAIQDSEKDLRERVGWKNDDIEARLDALEKREIKVKRVSEICPGMSVANLPSDVLGFIERTGKQLAERDARIAELENALRVMGELKK